MENVLLCLSHPTVCECKTGRIIVSGFYFGVVGVTVFACLFLRFCLFFVSLFVLGLPFICCLGDLDDKYLARCSFDLEQLLVLYSF